MSSKMLIDSSHPEETRVVVTKGNRLDDFDFESDHKKQIRGNIYLAKVTRVEPSLQAAFVEYGGNRHGFLAFSEIHPDYYQIPLADRQALVEEEAALASEEFDLSEEDEAEPADELKGSKSRRNRRGRGRNNKRRGGQARVPDAEPVAMEAILAALDADADDDTNRSSIAASVDDSRSTTSEELDDVFGKPVSRHSDDTDDDADDTETVEQDDALEESRPRKRSNRRNYKIQEVIKRRQIILVQVMKEERGNKGAALTTYLSLAGRYSVLMPNTARGGGISRKITNIADRNRMKATVRQLDVPKGMGVILRTAGADQSETEIQRDYDYLMRLWDNIRDLTLKSTAPALVYEEGNLIKRSIRDLFHPDIAEITVAGDEGYLEAKNFMRMLMPSHAKIVRPWHDRQPIFAHTGIEAELDLLIQPQVTLKSGGYIIINQTEALVAIDVNSGKSTREMSVEDTALATNLEAAEEVARQLRLRDLAGLIVIDFIDMEENRNNRAVEKKLKECLKHDRARIQIGRISHFGLLEMSRQRMRASVLESTMTVCEHCGGTGYVRSVQSISLHLLRALEDQLQKSAKHDLVAKTSTQAALYVLNNKRESLSLLEKRFGVQITIEAAGDLDGEMYKIDKGDLSTMAADPDAHRPIAADHRDDPDQIAADEAAYAAYTAETAPKDGDEDSDGDDDQSRGRKRRRRRRGKRDNKPADDTAVESASSDDEDENGQSGRKKNRRRNRGRRGGRNRRDRNGTVPAAEPVGPLADMIAAEQEQAKAAQDADSEKAEDALVAVPSSESGTPVSNPPVAESAEARTNGDARSDMNGNEAVAADAGESAESAAVAPADGPVDEEQARVRATESTLNLDVKPIVSSTADTPAKPKRGWWSRK